MDAWMHQILLKFWIKEANRAAGKKALTKTGTVDALRMKLAEFYGLDLAATPEKPAGPVTRGHDVQKRQCWGRFESLNKRRQRARKEKVERDLKWMWTLQAAKREAPHDEMSAPNVRIQNFGSFSSMTAQIASR
ncbi:hypothetical protein EV702DRAFT_1204967 [Suillus placidus]|uniref:Uncharacterized protein n=1 Tax=Suillus placidus TaxID=48579 RepID=A0A9P6ZG19_9AGAM|nr:hypothetical protein EV702DRAFT_1204967 [Suillus placidus]